MSDPKRHLLFIDDEQAVLDGLRRGMHRMSKEWRMSFVLDGETALRAMRDHAPDVVVSDMRMPGMSGRDILTEVRSHYPRAVRLILSGYADTFSVMQVAGIAHQYLSKPCDCAELMAAIVRSYSLRTMLNDPALMAYIANIDTLPTLPKQYQRILKTLQAATPDMAEIIDVVKSDVVMTSLILKLANSAFFGARQTFTAVDRAVMFLGIDTISGLVLSHGIFTEFGSSAQPRFDVEELWNHSLSTAASARALARHEGWPIERVDEAFLAGILHHLGKLLIAMRPLADAPPHAAAGASAAWDAGHELVGAYLLGLWGFSDSLIEAIAFQHTPSLLKQSELSLAGLLHVADQLSSFPPSQDSNPVNRQFEPGYLESAGLMPRLAEWERLLTGSAPELLAGTARTL